MGCDYVLTKQPCLLYNTIDIEVVKVEKKRKDYVSWDEYFIGVAHLSSMRSKDPQTQVGSVIVDENHRIVSLGYNGMPRGIDDDNLPWGHGEGLDSKYLYVCHAEFNAVLNVRSGASIEGCTIYSTLFPCNECAKAIIQSGIKEVVYDSDKYADSITTIASKRLFDLAGVKYRQYKGRRPYIQYK